MDNGAKIDKTSQRDWPLILCPVGHEVKQIKKEVRIQGSEGSLASGGPWEAPRKSAADSGVEGGVRFIGVDTRGEDGVKGRQD